MRASDNSALLLGVDSRAVGKSCLAREAHAGFHLDVVLVVGAAHDKDRITGCGSVDTCLDCWLSGTMMVAAIAGREKVTTADKTSDVVCDT